MLWLSILFLLLAATFNSLVDSVRSNYYKKIVIEYNGHKYINPYAFSEMNFTLETSVVEDFKFVIRKGGSYIFPIKMYLSTSSPSTNVICNANRNHMECKAPSHDTLALVPELNDFPFKLYASYDLKGLSFSTDGSKYFLKISSTFTPAYDTTLCPFLMESPSSVNLQESTEHVPEAVIPPNYDVCEESCDSLKNETGVKFGSKGTVEFTMALLEDSKEYKLLHSFGYFSPIYTLKGSDSCTKYSTKIKFNDGSLTFKRDGEKIHIETDFKPLPEVLKDVPISNASNVNFYFYGSSIYCTFFDPQNVFQLRLLKLPKEIAESMKSETILKIGHSSSVNECNETLKLLVGNGVKLLFPKSDAPNSTVEPTNTTLPANETEIAKTSKPANKTEEASFPLWAIILIGCIFGILLIGGLVFAICCLIKKRKNKSPKKTEISEVEKRMLANKQKKNEMDKNHEIGPEKKAAKKAEKKTEKKAEKKAGKKDEKKKTEEFSLIPTAAFPSYIIILLDEQEKLEKRLQEEKRQEEEEKNRPEEERYTTTEDGQPPLTAIAKTNTKSVSKTQTEAVEVGGTQTTQNSIQPSKSSTPEDLKQLPRKEMVLKSKTKTTDGTAPT